MSRSMYPRLALPLLSLALMTATPSLAQLPPVSTTNSAAAGVGFASGLPLAKDGAIAALMLDGGLLIHRIDGGSPVWLFARGRHDGKRSHVHLSVFADGSDAGYAIGSLTAFNNFSESDLKTLTAYANGADLSKRDGKWVGPSKQETYTLAADPAMGSLGVKLGAALLYLDAAKDLNESATSLVASGASLCGAVEAIAVDAVTQTSSSAAAVPSEGLESAELAATAAASVQYDAAAFNLKANFYCAGGWPPAPGTTPAFPPASPGFTPPTGTVEWSGTGCGANQVGNTAPCINSSNGQLCTCTCTQVTTLGASWKPNAGSCAVIPPGPGPGTPTGPGACSPINGEGPCTNAAGKTCICPCVTGPAGTGVWGTPSSCPSGSAPIAALFVLVAAAALWRQRH